MIIVLRIKESFSYIMWMCAFFALIIEQMAEE